MIDIFHLLRTELRGSWRYRWPAMTTTWIVCLLGWMLVFIIPDEYEARAQVYVDADSRLADVMGQVGIAPGVGARVFVVRQAMLGRPQLERVARETDLDLRARTREDQEKLITSLREKIRVTSGRSAQAKNLYTITFEDRDRKMAVAVVQTLLDAFVEDVLELKVQGTEDVTLYLEDQLNHYSGLLAAADMTLADFKKEYVGLLPGESGGVFERLQTQMEVLRGFQAELRTQEDRRTELRRQLQSDSPYLPEGAEQANGVAIPGSSIEATINEYEARQAELLLRFTERHPDVVAMNEQLEQLYQKRKADREALAASGGGIEGVANATNPVYQSVQIALNETSVKVAGIQSKVSQSAAIVRRLESQIDTIPEVEAKYAKLTRDYAQYNSLYNELLLRKERERMSTAGEDRDVVSFNIIDPPAASFLPVAPKRVLLLIFVLILGLGAGGAMAFFIHQLNPVFHEAKTLREITKYPVLGVVSMTWLERHRVGRRIDFSYFAAASTSLVVIFVNTIIFREEFVEIMRSLIWQATG